VTLHAPLRGALSEVRIPLVPRRPSDPTRADRLYFTFRVRTGQALRHEAFAMKVTIVAPAPAQPSTSPEAPDAGEETIVHALGVPA
jgi:hypothetical protein